VRCHRRFQHVKASGRAMHNRPPTPGLSSNSSQHNETAAVRFELSFKTLLMVLALIAGVWLLLSGLEVLLVLVTALMLVGALAPVVAWLEQRQVRRNFAIGLVFAVGTMLTAALVTVTIPTLVDQVKAGLNGEAEIREKIATYLDQSHLTTSLADDLRRLRYLELLKDSKRSLFTLSARLIEVLAYLAAAVFLAFYVMLDRDRLRGALYAVVPRRHHIRLSRILLNLATIVGGYIRGQLLTCVISAVFIFGLLTACGVPNALTLAVFGGLMDLLPYIGLFLTMIVLAAAALAKGPVVAGTVLVLMLLYEEFESRILVPLVYGRALRLPPSVVFFSLILGTALGGIVGALLALPMAAAILMLVEELRVELPGDAIQPEQLAQWRRDTRTEREYERRAESMPADQAAAIAVEIVDKQREEGQAGSGEKDQTGKDGVPPAPGTPLTPGERSR
jgi:putative heme transporter